MWQNVIGLYADTVFLRKLTIHKICNILQWSQLRWQSTTTSAYALSLTPVLTGIWNKLYLCKKFCLKFFITLEDETWSFDLLLSNLAPLHKSIVVFCLRFARFLVPGGRAEIWRRKTSSSFKCHEILLLWAPHCIPQRLHPIQTYSSPPILHQVSFLSHPLRFLAHHLRKTSSPGWLNVPKLLDCLKRLLEAPQCLSSTIFIPKGLFQR